MRRLSIDPRFFPVMLALTWVSHALGRLERVRAFGEPGPDSRQGNRHVAFVQALAENRERLFRKEKT